MKTERRDGVYILQGRNDTADALSRARSGSRSGGSHPVAADLDCLTSIHTISLTVHLIGLGRGWSKIASATWEGERSGSDEGLRLGGVLRMGLDRVHVDEIVCLPVYDLR
jgi:hypothetical protein